MNELIQKKVPSDIWVLTEANLIVTPGADHQAVATDPVPTYDKGQRRAIIWTHYPISETIETCDSSWAVCVCVETTVGPLLVYGFLTPHSFENVPPAKRFEHQQEALERHVADWEHIHYEHPDIPLCLAGDFNVTLKGALGGRSQRSRDILNAALEGLDVVCITDRFSRAINHICLSRAWSECLLNTGGWTGMYKGSKVSVHTGYYVDVACSMKKEMATAEPSEPEGAVLTQAHS